MIIMVVLNQILVGGSNEKGNTVFSLSCLFSIICNAFTNRYYGAFLG